jgi:chromate transporter
VTGIRSQPDPESKNLTVQGGLAEQARPHRPQPSLSELFRMGLYLGAVGFGGGVSVLAAIEALLVRRRGWLSEREFSNTATIAQMLPGGAAANALAVIGLRFRGIQGAAVSYAAFVLPGAVSILALAWLYVRFGTVPRADAFLAGLNAAVVGIIMAITVRMARTSVARTWQMGVVALALLLSLVGNAGPLEVAFLGIALGLGWDLGVERTRLLRFRRSRRRFRAAPRVVLPEEGRPLPRAGGEPGDGGEPREPTRTTDRRGLILLAAAPALPKVLLVLLPVAVVFFRTGLGAYGGGFATIPALHAEVVGGGWITEHQFADAVAVGKLTPGPVLLMATFLGYLKEGVTGAVVATVSILAAPFVLVVSLSSWLTRMRSRRWMRAAFRGLTPAVVGLMLAAALVLGRSMQTGAGLTISAATALALIRFERINPVVLMALGGTARMLIRAATGV